MPTYSRPSSTASARPRKSRTSQKRTPLAAWLQLIYAYSNGYPLYATLCYAYKYGLKENQEQAIEFLQSVVRYCYYMGSTTVVKFEVFNIIRQLFISLPVKPYFQKNLEETYFNQMGRLKYGYALLAHYLQNPDGIPGYTIDKLITSKDLYQMTDVEEQIDYYNHSEDLGNFVVLDVNKKNYIYKNKRPHYLETGIASLKAFLEAHETISVQDIADRSDTLKTTLVKFFKEPEGGEE